MYIHTCINTSVICVRRSVYVYVTYTYIYECKQMHVHTYTCLNTSVMCVRRSKHAPTVNEDKDEPLQLDNAVEGLINHNRSTFFFFAFICPMTMWGTGTWHIYIYIHVFGPSWIVSGREHWREESGAIWMWFNDVSSGLLQLQTNGS